ncbi:MAG TPA: LCP family protein [Firmicutes bacterium]|nr:LCP family protein [Bacillota bacterium]
MAQRTQRKRKKKNTKLRRQKRIVLLLVVIIFVLAAVIAVSDGWIRRPQVETPDPDSSPAGETVSARKDGFYTILICGTDDGNGGSDTIMLAAVDTETKAIHVVSIPRDTLVNEDWTVKKINSAYNRSGIEGVEEQVEKIVGFPVDFYVTVDLQAFIDLVNAIDGVDFEVPIDMNYDDPAQDLHIHFSAGMQHLDGQEAMEVVRFRHNNDGSGYPLQDLDRIKTQQAFLKTVADKLFSLQSVIKVPEFARIFFEYVDSDLTLGEMVWFGNQALSIGSENIHFHTLPGEAKTVYGGSYYVLDEEACLTLVNECLNPYKEDRTAADLDIRAVS